MSPIADLQLPYSDIPEGVTQERLRQLCEVGLDITHRVFAIPDAEDREVRVGKAIFTDSAQLAIELTAGEGTYEKGVDFSPTEAQIVSAGTHIQQHCKEFGIPLTTVIRIWDETAWMLRRKDAPPPSAPLSEEEMKRIGSIVKNPEVRLYISPEVKLQSQHSSNPEVISSIQVETEPFNTVTKEVAERFSQILGIPFETINARVIETITADADFSLEFDCMTENGILPPELRDYLAETAEAVLNQNELTQEGDAEVWIRQNRPYERRFE